MKKSNWPNGPYALLMPSTGCPEDEVYGWSPGHINITTEYPMEILVKTNESMTLVPISDTSTKLAGPLGDYFLQISFCFKHRNWVAPIKTSWPVDSVSVFGALEGCPTGMDEKEFVISLPPARSWWTDGYLPHFEVHADDNGLDIRYKLCILNATDTNADTVNSKPFIFLKEYGTTCKITHGLGVEEETLALMDTNGKEQTYTNISFCIYTSNKSSNSQEGTSNKQSNPPKKGPPNKRPNSNEVKQSAMNCQRQLGITSGTIEDYQITASSWDTANPPYMARLPDTGWCPAVDDLSPYLQIDLYSMSIIGGVILYHRVNYVHTVQHNIYTRIQIPEGCRSFKISYGIFFGVFTDYAERPFVVDSSQEFEQPQTIRFWRPFLARYVRIHPVQPIHGGRLCLRMELMGCSTTVKLRPACQRPSPAFWTPMSGVTPGSILSTMHSGNVSSLGDCQQACEQQMGECKAIQYTVDKTCSLYSSPYPVTAMDTRSQPQSFYALLVCQIEPSVPEYIDMRDTNEQEMSFIVLDKLLLTSIGFPMHYAAKAVFKWTVISAYGGFIRLTFATIDLYDQSVLHDHQCPGDSISIDGLSKRIIQQQNGLSLTFPTEKSTFRIVFDTCMREYQRSDRRKGFELIVKSEEFPTLWKTRVNTNVPAGHIMSYCLLGLSGKLPASQEWDFPKRQSGGLYVLTFWHFNIPCLEQSSLTVRNDNKYNELLCNTRRKPRREYKAGHLFLTFTYRMNLDVREESGFGAFFKVEPRSKSPPWLLFADGDEDYDRDEITEDNTVHNDTVRIHVRLSNFSETCDRICLKCSQINALDASSETMITYANSLDPDETPHNAVSHQDLNFCSGVLNKCYRYRRQQEYTDWLTHAKHCNELGYHHLVFHGRKEMEYLQALLIYLEDEQPYQIYTHIGLVRNQESSRINHIWQDGTSVTFSAWDSGEPYNILENRCTGISVDVTTGEGGWLTSSCSSASAPKTGLAFASVCEKPFLHKNSSGLTHNVIPETATHVEFGYEDMLFQCNSTEWIIYKAVCDGIDDCSDGSDELKCTFQLSERTCLANEFACGSGGCIHVGRVCDFTNDCRDGSDEYCYISRLSSSSYPAFPECNADEYTCANKQCVPMHARCDAIDDCYDASDEHLCETCNAEVAFSCGDLTCIPRSLVCNNIPDCDNNRDEESCAKTYRTCYDYWRDGYDKNVTFQESVSNFLLECQLHMDGTHTLGLTSVLHWRFAYPSKAPGYDTALLNARFLRDHGQMCSFEITEKCKYYMEEIASYLDPTFNGSYSFCRPRTVEIFTDGYQFWMNGVPENIISETIVMEKDLLTIKRISGRVVDIQNRQLIQITATRSPVVCKSEYVQTDINCGDGMTVSADRRCLYDFTRAGVIDGCRNFKHLEDCDTIACPHGYSKCRGSFCLAQRFVCDGERQCPGGEDEENCSCTGGNHTLAVTFYGTLRGRYKSNIFKFARQFLTTSVTMYAVSYMYFEDKASVAIREIHPYNEALNMAEEETFVTERVSMETEIIHRFNDSSDVKIISIVEDDMEHLDTDVFLGILNVDHVYRLRLNKTMQRQTGARRNKLDTYIAVKSFDILSSVGSNLLSSLCKNTSLSRYKGDFKCMTSTIHIPLQQICDGTSQCPHGDDEAICNFDCPRRCSCEPYIANCQSSNITEIDLLDIDSTTRVLDISNNTIFDDGMLTIQKQFPYLVKMCAKRCKLTSVRGGTFTNATSLVHLDLSFNEFRILRKDSFVGLRYIKVLNLQGNALLSEIEPRVFRMFRYIDNLLITKSRVSEILPNTFNGLKVHTLDISGNDIHKMYGYAFNNLTVEEINFERNEIKEFDTNIFAGVQKLKSIRSPSHKFCCSIPSTVESDNCWPHENEISSCEDLMRNTILQTLLWVIGAIAVVFNGAAFLYRLFYNKQKVKNGFRLFVLNLAVSDFLMGVYMIIIASADLSFRRRYMLKDDYWRNSIWCNIAGILATVSSEASVLLMCLITVDRFLVIKFPFGQRRFHDRSSRIAVAITWVISLVIALIPVIVPDYFQGSFYSTSGVCLAMPLTHRRPPGWLYSFLIFVGLNFVAFILIAVGQCAIYLEIRKSSKRMEQFKSQRRNDISIARNLFLVISTDFLCWFPIGVMAIMVYGGQVIPDDVYAWTAVMILPLNSALNPFLYTLSAIVGFKKTEDAPKAK